MEPVQYLSDIDDNRRWRGFPFVDGDIVVSTRSKHGTTWVQTICLLLVHGPVLPERLGRLSPWVDVVLEDREQLLRRLGDQRHRRVLKTHTPLDGLPADRRATYVLVARHPLDAALSLYHQSANIDRGRVAALMGEPAPPARADRPSAEEWLREWACDERGVQEWLESPRGVLHHVTDAWTRAEAGEQRVLLVHYADLEADLEGEMRRLATQLDLEPAAETWPTLVAAAGFGAMSGDPTAYAPDPHDTLRDRAAFFRSGRSGEGVALLPPGELAAFEDTCRRHAPGAVVRWLLRPAAEVSDR